MNLDELDDLLVGIFSNTKISVHIIKYFAAFYSTLLFLNVHLLLQKGIMCLL